MDYISNIQKFNDDKLVNKLRLKYERPSFLDSLAVSRRELSHSAFLAELLKSDSFHGVGTLPLQLFLEVVLRRAVMQHTVLQEKPDKEVMFPSLKSGILSRSLSLSDVDVMPEVSFNDKNGNSGRVDILVSCRTKPLPREDGKDVEFLNIIIENKIYAKEQDRQTDKYYKHFNAFLKNKASEKVDTSKRKAGPRALYNLYVYLTPAAPIDIEHIQEPESACKECVQICYQDLLDYVVDPLLESYDLSSHGRFYLEEYKRSLGVSFDCVESADKTNYRGTKWNTIIMAIGRKESDDLCKFWNDYKELLTAAINEANRLEDEDDENEDNISGKRILYEYKGQPFTMGRLVQAVIIDHLPEYTKDGMNGLFKELVGEIVTAEKDNKSYFEETSDVLTKDNLYVKVFRQWSENRQYKFSDFCKKAKELGWYEVKKYEKEALTPEESMVLKDFFENHKKLITISMEVVRRSSLSDLKDEVAALQKRTGSHRNRTTYNVTLHANNQTRRNLSWGRLVLAVLQDYVSINDCSSSELKCILKLSSNVLREFKSDANSGFSGYFTGDLERLFLTDGTYVVKKGWNEKEIAKFIENASSILYDISIPDTIE